jgi:ribosomal protein L16 Arg81 hydroxylase
MRSIEPGGGAAAEQATIATAGPGVPPSWMGLDALVAPLDAGDFMSSYWKRKPFLSTGSSSLLDSIRRALGGTDVAELLPSSGRLAIWPRDRPGQKFGTPDVALHEYENNLATLYFPAPGATVARWSAGLAAQLGELIVFTDLFAVRSGGGTGPHYDRNQGFTVQLKGRKRWIVAPNHFIEHPMENWHMAFPPPRFVDPGLAPSMMPEDGVEFVLEPGSILYCPRGFLHQISALDGEESLSLNFSVQDVSWAELMLAALRSLVVADPEFRLGLTEVFGQGRGRDAFATLLPDKLQRFREVTDTMAKHPTEIVRLIGNPSELRSRLQDLSVDTGYPHIWAAMEELSKQRLI